MGDVWNTVKNGATVPRKFKVFAGSTELTNTSVVIQPLTATQSLCSGGPTNDIEILATGSTGLRYDTTTGQFIYNWQTDTQETWGLLPARFPRCWPGSDLFR